jgi:hypothetical protein
MKCFFCDTEVRWNNDFDLEDVNPDSEYTITSMYECDNCKAWESINSKVIDTLETDIGIKDWHIQKLKDEIKDLKDALEKTE